MMSEQQVSAERGRTQVKVGTVVRDKMDKTVVVAVQSTYQHRLYRRYMKRTRKYFAHDESNECRHGDRVEIALTRPLSRLKRWRVRKVLKKAGRS